MSATSMVAAIGCGQGAPRACGTPVRDAGCVSMSAAFNGNVTTIWGNVGNVTLASLFAAAQSAGSVWNRVWGNVLGNAGALCWLGPENRGERGRFADA
jgi:hypothetical protein